MNPVDYLKDVPANNYFILRDGRIIKNIEELLDTLKNSEDSLFYYHVTIDRNDFAEWIKYCVKYVDLYNKLIIIKDKDSFIKVLQQEIDFLKNPKVLETMKFFSDAYNDSNKNLNNNLDMNIVNNNFNNSLLFSNNSDNTSNISLVNNESYRYDVVLDFESFLDDVVKEINDEILLV